METVSRFSLISCCQIVLALPDSLFEFTVEGLMQLDKIWTYLDKSGSFCVDFPRNHQLKN